MGGELREPAFGRGVPYSLGVEEELFLVDPLDGHQLDARERVLDQVARAKRGNVPGGVHAGQIELIRDVCAPSAGAIGALADLRRPVLATGIGLIGSAPHPAAAEGEAGISDRWRYHYIA